jgi:hypothetical protein
MARRMTTGISEYITKLCKGVIYRVAPWFMNGTTWLVDGTGLCGDLRI